MKNRLFAICLAMLSATAAAQAGSVWPLMRYNSIVETTYILHRCGALTVERRAWLKHVLDHALRAMDWDAAQIAAHGGELTRDFERRYPTVAKERCAELTRSIDQERTTTVVAP